MPGLFVRFTVLGRIEFEARYLRSWPMRVAGMQAKVRLILGEFPKMKIEQARAERSKFTQEIRDGIDPANTRPFKRARKKPLRLVKGFFWQWFDQLPEKNFSEKMAERRVVITEYEDYIFSAMPRLRGFVQMEFAAEGWMHVIGRAYKVDRAIARRLWWGVNEALQMAMDVGVLKTHTLSGKTFSDFEEYARREIREGYL